MSEVTKQFSCFNLIMTIRAIGFATGVFLLTLAGVMQSSAQNADKPLVVPFFPVSPFAEYGPDGERTGFLIELARLIGEEIGVPIAYLDVESSREFVEAQISGEAEMVAGIVRLPPLVATNVFSTPVATEQLRLSVLVERTEEFEAGPINGMRVGIVPPALGSEQQEFLARNMAIEFETPEAAFISLLIGNVDALLIPEPVTYSIARRAREDGRIHFVGEPIREIERVVAIHESRADLLDPINAAIARIEADGRLPALRSQYNIVVPPPPPETLIIGFSEFPPYKMIGADGEPTGFSVEILRNVVERAGLDAEFKQISQEEWVRGPVAGEIDMLTLTPIDADRQQRMDFTLPTLEAAISIFTRAGQAGGIRDLDDLAGQAVGVVADNLTEVLANANGGLEVVSFERQSELLDALVDGQVSAALFNSENFLAMAASEGVDEKIAEVRPPFHVTRAAPALRFGLGEVREKLNAVISGYLVSSEYAALRVKYFSEPVFWTQGRITGLAVGTASLLALILGGSLFLRRRNLRYMQAEREQKASEVLAIRDELETIFNAATSGIVALDPAGLIVRINNRARHMLGGTSEPVPFAWPENIKFLDIEAMKPLDASADPIRRALSGNQLMSETHLMRHPTSGEDGRYVRVDNARVENEDAGIHSVLVIDDVSNEERNRQVVERKSRLDALGQLTGGIAHDFNNLLASLLYAVDLARNATDLDKREMYLETAASSVQRGRALTARLLAFARRQPGLATVRKTSVVFDEFEKLIRPMLEAQIEISLVIDEPDLHHYCDQTQLETALMNLVLNSRDAILRSGKGSRINIRARAVRSPNQELDGMQQGPEVQTEQGAELKEEPLDGSTFRYVEVSVSDNGPGMDEDTLARCTDPFFTTKGTNSGTGLGLAMVYGFVRQADGDLRVYSEPDIGTTVQMTLPRGTQLGAREAPMPVDVIEHGSGEIILVVEDELQLLVMITDVLEQLGYVVVSAKSGQDALDLVEAGERFDLLLTDVVMPGKVGGFDLARRVREIRPDMAVIYTSGYTGFTASEMGEIQAPLLQKPAPPAELADAIRHALAKSE